MTSYSPPFRSSDVVLKSIRTGFDDVRGLSARVTLTRSVGVGNACLSMSKHCAVLSIMNSWKRVDWSELGMSVSTNNWVVASRKESLFGSTVSVNEEGENAISVI